MTEQIPLTRAQQRHIAARCAAIYTAERAAMIAQRKPAESPPPMTRRQLVVVVVLWIAFVAAGLWLASHDPDFLSRAAQRAIDGAA